MFGSYDKAKPAVCTTAPQRIGFPQFGVEDLDRAAQSIAAGLH